MPASRERIITSKLLCGGGEHHSRGAVQIVLGVKRLKLGFKYVMQSGYSNVSLRLNENRGHAKFRIAV